MAKEYYMLFDKEGMPAAVFLTETAEESRKLFCTLYRCSWEKIIADGNYMEREKDVSSERWEEIYQQYKARDRDKLKKIEPEPLQVPESLNIFNILNTGPMQLETAKYMRNYDRPH